MSLEGRLCLLPCVMRHKGKCSAAGGSAAVSSASSMTAASVGGSEASSSTFVPVGLVQGSSSVSLGSCSRDDAGDVVIYSTPAGSLGRDSEEGNGGASRLGECHFY